MSEKNPYNFEKYEVWTHRIDPHLNRRDDGVWTLEFCEYADDAHKQVFGPPIAYMDCNGKIVITDKRFRVLHTKDGKGRDGMIWIKEVEHGKDRT